MKYKLLTPSGVETNDTWDTLKSIPRRVPDRFEHYFESEEAEVIEIDDQVNPEKRRNLGCLIDVDKTRVSTMNQI